MAARKFCDRLAAGSFTGRPELPTHTQNPATGRLCLDRDLQLRGLPDQWAWKGLYGTSGISNGDPDR